MACNDTGACCVSTGCITATRCCCQAKGGTFYAGVPCSQENTALHFVNSNTWTAVPGTITAGIALDMAVIANGSAYGGLGVVSWNNSGGETGPEGTLQYPLNGSCQVFPGVRHMKAIGRIRRADNTFSDMFEIGYGVVLAAPATGTLEFRQNDTCVGDNAGTYYLRATQSPCASVSLSATPPVIQSAGGPGTELKALLHTFGITSAPGCPCNEHAQEMDSREAAAPGWCEQNMDTILGWLEEQAQARGMPFIRTAAKMLVKRAISLAKRKSAPQGNSQ
jgi:hypothetical protein